MQETEQLTTINADLLKAAKEAWDDPEAGKIAILNISTDLLQKGLQPVDLDIDITVPGKIIVLDQTTIGTALQTGDLIIKNQEENKTELTSYFVVIKPRIQELSGQQMVLQQLEVMRLDQEPVNTKIIELDDNAIMIIDPATLLTPAPLSE